jgi:hypothetical protein
MTEPGRIGLCAHCRHARLVRSGRGSVFYQCGKAWLDPGFPRYPRLPVVICPGFEEPGESGAAGAPIADP